MKVRAVFKARVVDRPVVVFTAAGSSVSDKPQVCGDGGSDLDKNLLCADCAVNFDLLALVIELPRLYDIGSRCRPRLHKKRLAPFCRRQNGARTVRPPLNAVSGHNHRPPVHGMRTGACRCGRAG